MPMSLNSLLTTYPYKRKDCLYHICAHLELPRGGIVETMRNRIVDFVDRQTVNKEGDTEEMRKQNLEKRRELVGRITTVAHEYNEKRKSGSGALPLSPIVTIGPPALAKSPKPSATTANQPASQPLFSDSQTIAAHEGEEQDSIAQQMDELEQLYNDITQREEVDTSVVFDATLEEDEFPGIKEARKRKLHSPFVYVEDSIRLEGQEPLAQDGVNGREKVEGGDSGDRDSVGGDDGGDDDGGGDGDGDDGGGDGDDGGDGGDGGGDGCCLLVLPFYQWFWLLYTCNNIVFILG